CWDITYLRSPVRGEYFYLFMMLDVWSRRIIGHVVHEAENSELAAEFMKEVWQRRELQLLDDYNSSRSWVAGTDKCLGCSVRTGRFGGYRLRM
ncbi:MAG: transposase family protein, partial [Myxococcales bacterium]|nr:transposase family protein [Myxococcales bacterium]